MRTLNAAGHQFSVGKTIVVVKEYKAGTTILKTGTVGYISSVEVQSFPDIGLFDIRILGLDFGTQVVHMGEPVAREYMRLL